MTFIYSDRVKDTSTTSGTGPMTVSGGAPSGFQTFSAVCAVNDTFYYCIEDPIAGAWETGEATYTGTNVVARTTVRESSNAGALVNFASNIKNVFLTPVAYFFQQASTSNIGDIKWTNAVLNSTSWKLVSPPSPQSLSQASYPDLYALVGQKYLDLSVPTTPTTNAGSNSLASVIWNATMAKFIAVGGVAASAGVVITSPVGGASWTSRDTSGTARWASVASSGTLAIAVTNVTAGTSLKSTDAITWSAGTGIAWSGTHALSGASAGLFYSTVASLFIAASNATGSVAGEIKTTADCVTWTSRTTPWTSGTEAASTSGRPFAEGNSIIVLMSNAASVYATSTDGINWTRRTTGTNAANGSVFFANGVFIMTHTVAGYYATSTDGINWTTSRAENLGNAVTAVAVIGTSVLFTAGAGWDLSVTSTPTLSIASADLITWNTVSTEGTKPSTAPIASDGTNLVFIPSTSATSNQISLTVPPWDTTTSFGLPIIREISTPAWMRVL